MIKMDNLKVKTFSGEKKLPSNIEAEQALIGSVLVQNIFDTHTLTHHTVFLLNINKTYAQNVLSIIRFFICPCMLNFQIQCFFTRSK